MVTTPMSNKQQINHLNEFMMYNPDWMLIDETQNIAVLFNRNNNYIVLFKESGREIHLSVFEFDSLRSVYLK